MTEKEIYLRRRYVCCPEPSCDIVPWNGGFCESCGANCLLCQRNAEQRPKTDFVVTQWLLESGAVVYTVGLVQDQKPMKGKLNKELPLQSMDVIRNTINKIFQKNIET